MALVVHLIEAEGLAAADRDGLSDPYVVLRAGDVKWRSSTVKRSLTPKWNESWSFPSSGDCGLHWLIMEVWDSDFASSDDSLGHALIPMRQAGSRAECIERVRLGRSRAKVRASGIVHVKLTFESPCQPVSRERLATEEAMFDRACAVVEHELIGRMPADAEALEAVVRGATLEPAPAGLGARGTLYVSNVRLLFVCDEDEAVHGSGAVVSIALSSILKSQVLPGEATTAPTVSATVSSYFGTPARKSEARPPSTVPGSAGGVCIQAMPAREFTILFSTSLHGPSVAAQLHARCVYQLANTGQAAHPLLDPSSAPIQAVAGGVGAEAAMCTEARLRTDGSVDSEAPVHAEGSVGTKGSAAEAGVSDGWHAFDPETEFRRQGVVSSDESPWRLSKANETYELCATYPRCLVVPVAVNDVTLSRAAEHRSRGRLPVLVWAHPHNGAVICRASQPRSGLQGHRSADDEELVRVCKATVWGRARCAQKCSASIIAPRVLVLPREHRISSPRVFTPYAHTCSR